MFSIHATIEVKDAPWTKTRQVPTFYLDETVQGITGKDHAEELALEVLDPTGNLRESPYHRFSIAAVRV